MSALLAEVPDSLADPALDHFWVRLAPCLAGCARDYATQICVDPDELLQQFVLKVYAQRDFLSDLKRLDAIEHRAASVLCSLRHLAIDLARRERSYQSAQARAARLMAAEALYFPPPDQCMEEAQRQHELEALVEELLASVPQTQREAVRLKFYEELSHEAIAERVGVAHPNAVTTRIKRALARWRKCLAGRNPRDPNRRDPNLLDP